MRAAVQTISWMLLFAALGAAGASWATPRFDLEADDAAEVAVGALASVGVDATVEGTPQRIDHEPEGGGGTVPAWSVELEVATAPSSTDTIELRVQRDAGQLVYVDDRVGDDDRERLLTEDQFAEMGEYRDASTTDRWVLRNGVASVAGVVVAAVCFVIAKRSAPLWEAP